MGIWWLKTKSETIVSDNYGYITHKVALMRQGKKQVWAE
jgi:hypothetical protein